MKLLSSGWLIVLWNSSRICDENFRRLFCTILTNSLFRCPISFPAFTDSVVNKKIGFYFIFKLFFFVICYIDDFIHRFHSN
jgi:hypothetical protein